MNSKQTTTPMKQICTGTIFRYRTSEVAKQVESEMRHTMTKGTCIAVPGDDGYFWVVSGRDYHKLVAAGMAV